MLFDLHNRLARNGELEGRVLAVFIEELDHCLDGIVQPPGTVQQFPQSASITRCPP
jgi:hypothetical protein